MAEKKHFFVNSQTGFLVMLQELQRRSSPADETSSQTSEVDAEGRPHGYYQRAEKVIGCRPSVLNTNCRISAYRCIAILP